METKAKVLEDFEIRSSIKQLTDFTQSVMWKDIGDFASIAINALHEDMEETTSEALPFLQGKVNAIRVMMDVPYALINSLKMKIDQPEEEIGDE